MNWDALGALSELVGAVAVVVSLIYVGIQLRRSNALSRADTIHRVQSGFSTVAALLAADADLSRIHRIAMEDGDLTADEQVRYGAYLVSYFCWLEDLYWQQKSGLYPVETGTGNVLEFLARDFIRYLGTPTGANWWREEGPRIFVSEFQDAVDDAVAEERRREMESKGS